MESAPRRNVPTTQAVLLGVLASGVNASTWSAIKVVFLALGVCFVVMLFLAFASDDLALVLHVLVFVVLGVLLFVLLSWFLSHTGLVSMEQQMAEMGMTPNEQPEAVKEDQGTIYLFDHSFRGIL